MSNTPKMHGKAAAGAGGGVLDTRIGPPAIRAPGVLAADVASSSVAQRRSQAARARAP
jgi:hypothetical protein